MTDHTTWRELHRTDDPAEALIVATTVAAMEFEVRWHGAASASHRSGDVDHPGHPPYIVEVPEEHWADLRGVIEPLLEEQAEFERRFQRKKNMRQLLALIGLILLAIIPVLLALLGCVAQLSRADRSAGSDHRNLLIEPAPALCPAQV